MKRLILFTITIFLGFGIFAQEVNPSIWQGTQGPLSPNQTPWYGGCGWSCAYIDSLIIAHGGSGSGWSLTGNAGTNSGTNFLGTTDNHSLLFKTNGIKAAVIDSNQNFLVGTANPPFRPTGSGGVQFDYHNKVFFLFGNYSNIGNDSLGVEFGNPSGTYAQFNQTIQSGINNVLINSNSLFTLTGDSTGTFSSNYGHLSIETLDSTKDVFLQDRQGGLLVGANAHSTTSKYEFHRTTAFIDGTQGQNKVFTSDSVGNASWKYSVTSGITGSEPSTPFLGMFYFDTTLVKMKFWNGTVWALISSTP